MKIYIDPETGQQITSKEALNIAIIQGKITVEERMTLAEAKKRGYKIPERLLEEASKK